MRKFTLLIALLACSIGFSQSAISDLGGDNNPTYPQQKATNQNVPSDGTAATFDATAAAIQKQIQNDYSILTYVTPTSAIGDDGRLHTTNPNWAIGSRSMPTTLTTLYAGGNGGNLGGAVYFDLTVGASDIDITSIDVNTAEAGGFTLDVYTLVGTYAGNEDNAGAWGAIAESGAGTSAGANNPSTATLNAPLTLLAGTTYGIAIVLDASHGHDYTNGDGTNQNYSNADLTLDLGSASNAPFTAPIFNPRVFNGGITYDLAGGGGGGACPAPVLEVNQDITNTCMANITQTDLAQSYMAVEPISAGAGIEFQALSVGLDVDLSLWDGLPNAGGTMLASGTSQTDGVNLFTDVFWDPVVNVTPGDTYYIVIDGDPTLPCVSGNTANPYPGGNVFANAGFTPFPTFDYTFRTYSCAGGGGGGGPCSESAPSNGFEQGYINDPGSGFITANDYTVAADEDFVLEQMTLNLFHDVGATVDMINITYHADAAGLPGAMIGSESVVPSGQVVVGNNFGFDVSEVDMDVTPFPMPGQAGVTTTYWIATTVVTSTAGLAAWEAQNPVINGFTTASFAGGWASVPEDGVYIFNGTCTPIGGGPACVPATYVAAGLPADIDPGGTSTADCVGAPNLYANTVAGVGTIGTDSTIDNVTINITHTWSGDLEIYLVSPGGAELLLWDNVGGSGDNFTDTQFEDGGIPSAGSVAPHTGVYEPVGGTFAAAFAGEAVTGDWQLKICDTAGGDTGTLDSFSLTICSPPPADNDTCADAFPIACGDVVVSETITNTDTGGNPAPDEWYSFTGTGTPQVVTLSLCDGGTDYDSFLRVFDACGGTEIAANDDSCGLQSELSFLSDGTSTYYIMVEGFASNSGNFSLEVTCVDPPPNDECAGAISMSCGETVVGETNTATFDASAPVCVTNISAPGVWYEFTDTTGLVTNYTLSMCDGGTDYDSKITVYSGDCGALACVVDNDDTCGLQSEVSWQGDGLTTYYILVHGFAANTGNFSMALTCAPVPPPNDMIANSIDVDEIGFPYTDPAVAMPAATTEAGTPAGCDNAGAKGVWYNFVPDGDGFATAEIITPGTASTLFSVNNGPLAGDYVAVAGGFGGALPNTPLTEDTALVIDADTTGDENDACDPIINGASLAGKIAVLRRGSCEFGFKALSAQNEGAIAVIVVNNVPDDPIVMGGGADGDDVTIPVVMVYDVDGEAIISELEGGGTVNVSLSSNPAGFSSVTFYTAPDENSIETDLTLVDWPGNQCVPGTSAIIPTTAGQAYYVYVTNGAITDIVIDGENLGVSDNTIEGFSYYPNPTDGILNLNAIDNIDDVAIYNLLGQQVLNQTIRATSAELNVSNLAVGAYIMKVSINGEIGTYKIIKR